MQCRICNNTSNNRIYQVKEMMFGLREKFEYFQCGKCDCLQINSIPDDLSKYYPNNYYSFSTNISLSKIRKIRKLRTKHNLLEFNLWGYFINLLKKFPHKLNIFKNEINSLDIKILDVGCGNGNFLRTLYNEGFSNLTGIDPFIDNNIIENNQLKIYKKDVFQLNEQYDLIMLNHAFEHMFEQYEVLKQLKKLLNTNGKILIRIPIMSSYMWDTFGVNWIELDAPRHFYIHSLKSINKIANDAGLRIYKTIYDSTAFEILGSIQYEKNIPLKAHNSYAVSNEKSIFSTEDFRNAKNIANKLNNERTAGRACFYLKIE